VCKSCGKEIDGYVLRSVLAIAAAMVRGPSAGLELLNTLHADGRLADFLAATFSDLVEGGAVFSAAATDLSGRCRQLTRAVNLRKARKPEETAGSRAHTRLTLLASIGRENAAIEGKAHFPRSSRPGSRQLNAGSSNILIFGSPMVVRTPVDGSPFPATTNRALAPQIHLRRASCMTS
jgi:hypothetical protein